MAESTQDIPVPGNDWIDLNLESGIAVGTRMILTNTGKSPALLYEGDTKPTSGSFIGKPITTQDRPYAEVEVKSGSLNIWAKASRGAKSTTKINIQY